MKIAIIDTIGLVYNGRTLEKQGLGGSESAVILVSKELARLGFDVTVFNNCRDASVSSPGVYDGVRYIDNVDGWKTNEWFDITIVSRTVAPWTGGHPALRQTQKRILWLHDTFIEGDELVEDLIVSGQIDHVFTLSDWHSTYVMNADHGHRRNYEVLKKAFFQTRNGAVCHIPEVDINAKDYNHFVYNASATKGLEPLVNIIWPEIKKYIPEARLTCIGGFYRFREGAEPDAQEKTVQSMMSDQRLKDLGITFTGVIPQYEIAQILANASMMLYPGAFPETFGISSLESLLYRTPIVTCEFGALEETAVDLACYKIPYAIVPNSLFPDINVDQQVSRFLTEFFDAYENPYLLQQKRYYCDVVKDVAGWDTVALQWKQFFYQILGEFLPRDEYQKVIRINEKVSRVFGRTNRTEQKPYVSFGLERKITVVSPVWNAEDYIEKHILSVATQDYDDWEHIIVDDASTDDTVRIAEETILKLPFEIQKKFTIIKNKTNIGCISNQMIVFNEYVNADDIVVLLDGDDWLVNNNTIFKYLNDIYSQGYKFTYGSCWSLVDNIPLVAQDYPTEVKANKSYRTYHFNWKIPYTHLRTASGRLFSNLDSNHFKTSEGGWMKSGADNPLFYALIEQVEPHEIFVNKEIIMNYNDLNPLNDYKVNGDEQNKNADRSYERNEDKMHYVYKITNKNSGKAYVGQTTLIPSTRMSQHISSLRNGSHHCKKWVEEWNKDSNLENWILEVVWSGEASGKEAKAREANVAYSLDDDLRLNEDSALVTSYEKYEAIREMLNAGKKYVEIRDALGVSMGTISHVKNGKYAAPEKFSPNNDFQQLYFNDDPVKIPEQQKRKDLGVTKKIMIAIPTNKNIEVETFKSLWDLEVPEGYELDFQYFYGYQVDQIRNLIADWGKRYDYVLSIDSDIVVPPHALKNMLGANKDIISGLYIQRIPNTHTLEIYGNTAGGGCTNIPYHMVKNRGIIEIAACGMGICLINSNVLRAMDYPHFLYQSALSHADTVSEDVYFCMKARKLGFKVWADTSIQCRHIGQKDFIVEDEKLLRYRDIGENVRLPSDHLDYLEHLAVNTNPKVIFDIGSSVLHWAKPAREIWPDAQIILFEAMEDVGEYYHEEGFHDFFLGVLSDVPGKHVLFYSDPMNFGGNSYYRETTGFFDGKKVQKVTNTIDNLKKLYGIPNPDLVKMDVQGAELDILKGAVETFKDTRDFILELQHVQYNEGAPLAEVVIKYMEDNGYKLITNFTLTNVDGDYHFQKG